MQKTSKPYFNARIFWDTKPESLDFNINASSIIERVFSRGDVEDIRYCRRYYGNEKCREVLIEAKDLNIDRLHLISALFNIQREEFRCYKNRQLNPELFPY
jgi:hypothetical protein